MEMIKSRKFFIAIMISAFTSVAPVFYKYFGVTDMVTLAALGILGSVAVGYGVINVADAKNKLLASMPQVPDNKVEVNNTEVKIGG
jgi:hypothetical protein